MHHPDPAMPIFSFLLLLLLLSLLSLYFYLHRKSPSATSAPRGFNLYPLVGTLPDFIRNRHRFHDWIAETLARCPNNTAVFYRPGEVNVITTNPQNVEHMLKSNFDNYPKGPRFISLLRDFLGSGIFNADDHLWIMQRKTASYEFNTKSLRNFSMESLSSELQLRLIPILKSAALTNRVLDMQDILERFAFDNVCKLAFNVDPACLGGDATAGADFLRAFETATNISSGRFIYAVPGFHLIKKFLNIGSERKLRDSIAIVHKFADNIIKSRMEEIKTEENKEQDLLSRFIDHESEDSSAEFLRDIIISFILAGRDTTSSALTWFFWLISVNPSVEAKILDELHDLRRASGRQKGNVYSYEEVRRMQYLQAAISEAMRLYPPVPVNTKKCREDDVLPDGTLIRKGWSISYTAYGMGRMESIWGEDCMEYRPERWMEKGVCKQESPFKYPVFHGGPRLCLGKDLAYIQMKSIAASVLEMFEIEVLMEKGRICPQYLLSLTLRINGGLQVRVKERSIASQIS